MKKGDKRNNIAADAGHFLGTEIDSTDFWNKYKTTKITRNNGEKTFFFLQKLSKTSWNTPHHQIKWLKTLGYLDTKDHDKIK